MATFQIHHITKYEYNRPVRESVNEIRIFPYTANEQVVISQEIKVTMHPGIQYYTDYWGNKTGLFNVLAQHEQLVIESRLVVKIDPLPSAETMPQAGFEELKQEIRHNLKLSEFTFADTIQGQHQISDIIHQLLEGNQSIVAITGRCSEYIYQNFTYIKGITDIETTIDEILEHRGGVCQDFAHLMLHILATLKIPARYVSGYVCPNKSGMRGEGATHAWVEVYIPGFGWRGIDPTNNVWTAGSHIKLAVGRHFKDCTPVKGTFKGPASQQLSVYVSVGHEDGHVFEEVTNVKMQVAQPATQKQQPVRNTSGQQQQ